MELSFKVTVISFQQNIKLNKKKKYRESHAGGVNSKLNQFLLFFRLALLKYYYNRFEPTPAVRSLTHLDVKGQCRPRPSSQSHVVDLS